MKKLVVILFALFSYSIFAQETEKRLALVIGNANYDKGVLKNPVNDARLIASTLDSLDFDVILKENLATKRDMTAAIREFGNKRSEYDVAFVYYAGHGIQVDDENFLLPTKETFEEEFDVMDYGVSVQNIMRYLRAQTNQVNILILDACRDNPFESSWGNTRSLKGQGLAKIPPPTGSLIAFSTDSGQTAPDGDGENSVYSISLAKNMLLKETSIDQVFRNVRAEVLSETDGMQRPVEATQLTGETFYLKRKNYSKQLKYIENLNSSLRFEESINLITTLYESDPGNSDLNLVLSETYLRYGAEMLMANKLKIGSEYLLMCYNLLNKNIELLTQSDATTKLDSKELVLFYLKKIYFFGIANKWSDNFEGDLKVLFEDLTNGSSTTLKEIILKYKDKILEYDPHNAYISYQVGVVLEEYLGFSEDGLNYYKKSINELKSSENFETNYKANLFLSYVYSKIGENDKSFEFLLNSHEINPDNLDIINRIAKKYTISGDYASSNKYLQKILGKCKKCTDYYFEIAENYKYLRKWDQSIKYFNIYYETNSSGVFNNNKTPRGLVYLNKAMSNSKDWSVFSVNIDNAIFDFGSAIASYKKLYGVEKLSEINFNKIKNNITPGMGSNFSKHFIETIEYRAYSNYLMGTTFINEQNKDYLEKSLKDYNLLIENVVDYSYSSFSDLVNMKLEILKKLEDNLSIIEFIDIELLNNIEKSKTVIISRLFGELGIAHKKNGDFKLAVENLNKSLSQFKMCEYSNELALVMNNVSVNKESIIHYNFSVDNWATQGYGEGFGAKYLSDRALFYSKVGEKELAEKDLRQALEIYKKLGKEKNIEKVTKIMIELIKIALSQKNESLALEYINTIYDYSEVNKYPNKLLVKYWLYEINNMFGNQINSLSYLTQIINFFDEKNTEDIIISIFDYPQKNLNLDSQIKINTIYEKRGDLLLELNLKNKACEDYYKSLEYVSNKHDTKLNNYKINSNCKQK